MSIDVNIHLWREPDNQYDSLDIFGFVLESVAVPTHPDNDGKVLTRFERVRVFEADSSNVVLDEATAGKDVSHVTAALRPYIGPRVHFEIASAYDYFNFNSDTRELEPRIRPLTINYYGPEYAWKGFPYKSYGPVRLDFSNTKSFRIPQPLLDFVKAVAESGGDTSHGLKMIAQHGRNFDAVSSVAKKLINSLDPSHLLICTDLEVHPLTAHALYHRDWREYSSDLGKIARLHEEGGVYFCDVASDDPAFIGPRKSPPDYGYLRQLNQSEDDFVELLQPILNAVLRDPRSVQLSKEQIEECFTTLESTRVEEFDDSYFLLVNVPPFEYLEEPYLKLYEQVWAPGG